MKDSGLLLFDLTRCLQPQVVPGKFRCHSSARSAVDKSGFDQERLVDIFDGSGIFSNRCCQGIESHRTALELFHNGGKKQPVSLIQSVTVYFQQIESK